MKQIILLFACKVFVAVEIIYFIFNCFRGAKVQETIKTH